MGVAVVAWAILRDWDKTKREVLKRFSPAEQLQYNVPLMFGLADMVCVLIWPVIVVRWLWHHWRRSRG